MNASLWQLAGWTMIHSLWLGAAVALAGGFLRVAARRAAPNTRYAISLATLALLAATPIAAAAWLGVNGVPQLANAPFDSVLLPPPGGEGWGEGQPGYTASHPSLTLPIEGREPEEEFETPLPPQVIDLAQATPTELAALTAPAQPAAPPIPHSPLPIPPTDHQSLVTSHSFPTYSPTHLLTSAIPHLPTLWLIGAPLTFTLLATGLVGSARLRRRATPLLAGSAYDACERLRQTLNITRRVALAVSDGVAQPILVGVLRPLILLPAAALAGWTPEQLDMVLLHELAHVRRRDNLVNLLQRIVDSILFYHPAVWLVSRQVRRDREECCDAAVIRHTNRPEAYATLLIDVASRSRLSAQRSPAQSLAMASAMASHPLAGRIRRILNIEEEPMRITRRTLAATLLLPALLAGAILYSGARAEDGGNAPPSQGGSVDAGGIQDAKQPSEVASDEKEASKDLNKTTTDVSAETHSARTDAVEGVAIVTYPIDNLPANIDLREWMELVASDPRIEFQWRPLEKGLVIAAPKSVHDELHDLLETGRKFSQLAPPRPTPAPQSADQAGYSQSATNAWNATAPRTDIHLPSLQDEIRRLESLLLKSKQDQIDLQTFKELALQHGQGKAAIEAAVAGELDKDPTIKLYQQNLEAMHSSLKEKISTAKNPNGADIQRARATIQQSEAQLAQYRQDAEKPIREQVAKLPNEALRDALTEYKIRYRAIDDNIAKYQHDLEAAKAKLLQLGAVQPAPILQPTIPPTADHPGSFPTIQEFPASADIQEVNAIADELRAAGRRVAVEQNVDGRKRIVDTTLQGSNSWNAAALASASAANLAIKLFHEKPVGETREITAPSPSTDAAPSRTNVGIPQLQNEIRNLETLIGGTQEELKNIEVFKELAVQNSQNNKALIDELVRKELEADQKLKTLNDRLLNIERFIADEELNSAKRSANDDGETIKSITALRETTEAKRDAYLAEATKAVHERITKTPNEALRAAATEYKIRRKAAEDNLAKYKQDLEAAKTKLLQLGANPAAPAPQPAPLLDRLEQLRLAFDQQRPLFSKQPDEQLQKVRYDGAKLPDIVGDHWPYLVKGIANKPGEPPISWGWTGLGNKNYELEAPAAAHEKLFRPLFNGHLPTVSATPAQESEPPAKPASEMTAEELKQKLVESRRRLENQLNELKKRSGKAIVPTQAEVELSAELQQRVQEWQAANDARAKEREARNPAASKQHASPAKNSSQDNAMPAEEHAKATPPTSFPTLEHQKLADRAYKLLGLELEPLTQPEIERVKKLGYTGGLKVVAIDPRKKETLVKDNILVGLHVWPTPDLQSLDAVLTREDLDDLSPLRFRAVVSQSASLVRNPEDRIISGRMPIDVDAFRSIRRNLPANHPNAAKFLQSNAKPASNFASISVVQAPITQKTGLFGGTVTTAYLKVKFDRLPGVFDNADGRTTPQDLERSAMNCLAIVKSPSVLKAALKSFTPQAAQDMRQDQAVEWLHKRLSATFPGDGEILELKLEGDDVKEDNVLLQAVIDAFVAAMNAPPEAPANANATPSPPAAGDLTPYANQAAASPASPPLAIGDVVLVRVAGALPEQPIDNAYNVDDLGTLAFGPTYGRVPVVGLTILEAEQAIQQKLQTVVQTAQVQVSRLSKPEMAPSPSENATFLYDGKSFEQWRDLWKLELNPERRTEAINALAAFGRTGHGQEAADAILEVAGEYNDHYGNATPEGKLLLAILDAVSRMPAEQWMPQVQQRIIAAQEPEKSLWIRHAQHFLDASNDQSEDARRHAAKLGRIPSDDLVTSTALFLWRSDSNLDQPETVELLRRGLQQKSPGISVVSLGFRHLDKLPEQLDVLVRDSGARSALNNRIGNDKEMAARLYPPLLELLKDPNRAEDRVGVLRALRNIGPVVRNNEPLDNRRQITNELTELLRTAPDDLLPAVFVAYSKYWGSSNYDEILSSLLEQGQLPADRIKHLRDLESKMYEEAQAP